jgi:ketosteroid isomerase-like protein
VDHPAIETMKAVLVGPAADDIVTGEAQLRVAQLTADVAALDRLLADELLFTGPDGELSSKAEDLAAHGTGVVRFLSHEPEELRIRQIGNDVAICALRARLSVEVAGTAISGTYRYTRVWSRDDGAWRVVAGHVSEVPQDDCKLVKIRRSSVSALVYTFLIIGTLFNGRLF